MSYGSKKKIIIAMIIAIVIIALVVGALYVVLATDLLKPTDKMFYKYLAKQYDEIAAIDYGDISKQIADAKKQVGYETNSTFKIESLKTESVANSLKDVIQLNINHKENVKKDKDYINVKALYNNTQLLDVSYAKSNDIVALKCDEIVKQYYVGIKNENIKDFLKNLGLTDVSQIPDKIETTNITEIASITDEEKNYIFETYFDVIMNSIPKDNYSKINDSAIAKMGVMYNTTAYRLDLSAEELRSLEIKLLETLKQDSITLNMITTKLKEKGLNTTINDVVKSIDVFEKNINASQLDTTKGLSIILYVYKDNVIQTEVILNNQLKITLDAATENQINSVNVLIDNLSNNTSFNTINLKFTKQDIDSKTITNLQINIDNKLDFNIKISNSGSIATGIVNDISAEISKNDKIVANVIYNAKTSFGKSDEDIIDLDSTKNCVLLSNYKKEQIQNVLNRIAEQTSKVIEEKQQKLTEVFNTIVNIGKNLNTSSNNIIEKSKQAYEVQKQANDKETQIMINAEAQVNELWQMYMTN